MKPVFTYIKHQSAPDQEYYNIGDEASCPAQYFSEYAGCPRIRLSEVDALPAGQAVILGGGGILAYPEFIARTAKARPTIIWGAGLNNRLPFDPQPVVEALRLCALVGIRDRKFAGDFGFEYAPCASCMHPMFAISDFVTDYYSYSVLRYQHSWGPRIPGNFHVEENMDKSITVERALRFIRTARTVITNSYHGAYWSQLAGKRVFLWQTADLRFFSGLPFVPPILRSEEELKLALDFSPPPVDNHIYRDCVRLTEQFRQRVSNFLRTL